MEDSVKIVEFFWIKGVLEQLKMKEKNNNEDLS